VFIIIAPVGTGSPNKEMERTTTAAHFRRSVKEFPSQDSIRDTARAAFPRVYSVDLRTRDTIGSDTSGTQTEGLRRSVHMGRARIDE